MILSRLTTDVSESCRRLERQRFCGPGNPRLAVTPRTAAA